MGSGLMYSIYRNQGQGLITLGVTILDRFYNLPLMKTFLYRFLRNFCNVETRYTHGQWADVLYILESGSRAYNSWSYTLDRFYNLPLMKNFPNMGSGLI